MIDNLIEGVQDKNIPISNLLRKAKVLASRLDRKDLLEWIDKELNGYEKNESVPEYRMANGQVKAFNPYRGWIPVLVNEPKPHEFSITRRGAAQSVTELEELLKNESVSYEMPFPDEMAAHILADAPMQLKVSLFIGRTEIVGILNTVRNKLFDWLLELDRSGASIEVTPSIRESKGYEDFDEKHGVLKVAGKEIALSKKNKETDAVLLMRTLKKDLGRYWYEDEIYEDWALLKQDMTENKAYYAARKINDEVEKKTGIMAFIDHGTGKFRVNPKHLS